MANDLVQEGSGVEDNNLARLLNDARLGSESAAAEIVERFRPYLLAIANAQLPDALRGKLGGSDLVQESLVEAVRGFDKFQGQTKEQLLAWLKQILDYNVLDAVRQFQGTAKRSVDREVALDANEEAFANLAGQQSSPSSQARKREQLAELERAMLELPANYREVIGLRNDARLSFGDIGREMGCSAEAARKLWGRALIKLQQTMEKMDDG